MDDCPNRKVNMQTLLLAHIGHLHAEDIGSLLAVAAISIIIFVTLEVTGRKD